MYFSTGEKRYKGENQEQYIPAEETRQERYPSNVLRVFSLGIHASMTRGMVFFWGIERYESY